MYIPEVSLSGASCWTSPNAGDTACAGRWLVSPPGGYAVSVLSGRVALRRRTRAGVVLVRSRPPAVTCRVGFGPSIHVMAGAYGDVSRGLHEIL